MSNPNICDTLKQNQRLFQIQNPPIRFNPVNPYLLTNPSTKKPFTAFDLNMRRKTEILKYAPNKQSNQTNSLTKSQRWSQIVKGNYQTESYTSITKNGIQYLNNKPINPITKTFQVARCPQNRSQLTISTACDIPGTPINLYEDDNVPLYNYSNSVVPYAIQNNITSPNWYIESYSNTISNITIPSTSIFNSYFTTSYTTPTTVATLYIVSPTYTTSTFSMIIPFGFYLAGDSTNSNYSNKNTSPIRMSISSIKLGVLVNNAFIALPNTPGYQYSWSNGFDISVDVSNASYSIGQYVGNIAITNIVLPTMSGNVYDFQLSYTLDISNIELPSYKNAVTNTVAGGISNITTNYANHASSTIGSSVPYIVPTTFYSSIPNATNGFSFIEQTL